MSPTRSTPLCALAAVAVLLPACSRRVETNETVSPDGKLALRIEIDESGGAAVSDVTSAFVIGRDSGAAPELIFRGSSMSGFAGKWRDGATIQLSYTDGYVSKCNSAPVLSTGRRLGVLGCK